MASLTLLISVSILGMAAFAAAFFAYKNSIEQNKEFLRCRVCSLALISFGFIVHTFGDYLGVSYGEALEHNLESLAHLIIFIALFFFIKASKSLFKESKKFHF